MAITQNQLKLEHLVAYFPPLGELFDDDTVTEIMIVSNSDEVRMFFECSGLLHERQISGQTFRGRWRTSTTNFRTSRKPSPALTARTESR